MADIVLKDRNGNDVTYEGIETVTFDTPTEGQQAVFTEGVAVEGLEIVPDFSGGDMAVNAPAGTLVKSAIIRKPVTEEFIVGESEGAIALDFSGGDLEVTPSAANKFISKVTIEKPEMLIPENIRKDVNVGGIIGTHEGGGGDAVWDDPALNTIRFIDFKGTIVEEWTLEEALEKTELPQPIEYEGLVFQEWNYTLNEIKEANWPLDVGAVYITDDGATRLIIEADNSSYLAIQMYCTVKGTVEISWGDGATEIKTATGGTIISHTYPSTGRYTISVKVPEGSEFGLGYNSKSVIAHSTSANHTAIAKYLKGLHIGIRTVLNEYATYYNSYLSEITIPNQFTSIASRAFYSQYAAVSLVIPRNVDTLAEYALYSLGSGAAKASILSLPRTISSRTGGIFSYSRILKINPLPLIADTTDLYRQCYHAKKLKLPDGITSVGNTCFNQCYNLQSVEIPDSVTSIGNSAFSSCVRLKKIQLPIGVITVGSSAFNYCEFDNIEFPEGLTSISSSAFSSARVKRMVIPESAVNIAGIKPSQPIPDLIIKGDQITSLPGQAAYNTVFLSDVPPASLTSSYIYDSGQYQVYVPDDAVDTYKAIFTGSRSFLVHPISEYHGKLPE